MKTKFFVILSMLTFSFANAQQQEVDSEMNSAKGVTFEKGDMFLEGSIKISTGGTTDYYGFSPKFGYLLNDKFAVGAKLNYSSEKVETTIPETKTNVFGIGAFARYYFLELDKKRFKAFAEAGLGFGQNKTKIQGFEDDTDNSITADITVGLNYFVTKNIAVTFTLANVLAYNSVSPENGASSDTFNLNINLFENIFDQPQFGLLYRF